MAALDTTPNFIFVGGAPRSGTTLLQNMLDSHADIVGGPEFLHLPDIIKLRNSMQPTLEKGWLEEYCTTNEADDHIKQLIDNFLLPIAKKHNISFISEKTPGNINVFSELSKLYPNAYFIQIVRDPRAVVASMLKVGRRGKKMGMETQSFTRNIMDAINYLKICYANGMEFQAQPDKKLFTLTYEDLVTRPEALARQICSFLDLPWDERMLRPDKQDHAGEKAITNEVWYNQKEYKRRPTGTEIDKWKKNLSFTQKSMLFYSFSDYRPLTAHGYRLTNDENASATEKLIYLIGAMNYILLTFINKIHSRVLKPLINVLARIFKK